MDAKALRETLNEAVFMFDDSALGLSVLLGPERKYVSSGDPRWRGERPTFRAAPWKLPPSG